LRYHDTLIEVVDTRTGRRLARQRLDTSSLRFTGFGAVQIQRLDEDGYPHVEVWQPRLPVPIRR